MPDLGKQGRESIPPMMIQKKALDLVIHALKLFVSIQRVFGLDFKMTFYQKFNKMFGTLKVLLE